MIAILRDQASVEPVESALAALGVWTRRLAAGAEARPALECLAHSVAVDAARLRELDGVVEVYQAPSKTPLVDAMAGRSVVAGGVAIGGGQPPVLMAGPCAAESEPQVWRAAAMAARAGARFLRGGAFKPRTSPYSFAGHGAQALGWLRRAADAHGLALVTEVMSEAEVDAVADHADLVQLGARSMQCFPLLAAVGAAGKPVLLKRGPAATIGEWLAAAEHLLAAGASGVVFCERGVRSWDRATRNLFDLGAVALLEHVHRLPVVADPSHAAGRVDLVVPLAAAALAAGASGLLVEAHPAPGQARSDGPQSLDPAGLARVGALFASPRLAVAP
jgi:3-deoxy-7-phosphoheptulonate synthase